MDMWQQYNVFGDFPPHDVTQRLHQIKQEDDISSDQYMYTASEKSPKKNFNQDFQKFIEVIPKMDCYDMKKKKTSCVTVFWALWSSFLKKIIMRSCKNTIVHLIYCRFFLIILAHCATTQSR